MRLRGWLQEVRLLSADQQDRLFALMDDHFLGVSRESFQRDLAEKTWIILLEEPGTKTLVGFSTLMAIKPATIDRPTLGIYSGDTIIDRRHWGDLELPRVWLRFLLDQAAAHPEGPTYWFLTSMGQRTYRVLPMFFRKYVPQMDRMAPPDEMAILDAMAKAKFGAAYDAVQGLIRFDPPRERLRPEIGHIPEGKKDSPAIRYFLERNPHWERGDELACLASIRPDNLTPFAIKLLGDRAIGTSHGAGSHGRA